MSRPGLHHKFAATRLALFMSAATLAAASPPPAPSFTRDIAPIFAQSCNGCHHPGKEKGGLDLTTYASLRKGGKHGVVFEPGKTNGCRLLENIQGPDPSMPKNADPLPPATVALIARWISESALDDTPPESTSLPAPPIYTSLPVITALAYSPDGRYLAVAGFHEVLLLSTTPTNNNNNHQILARLVGRASRIESFEFSPDEQHLLAVAAGSPGLFGEIQIWDPATATQLHAYRAAYDSVYGVHWSPDASRVAFGGADKTARVLRVSDGHLLVTFDQHSDWVFGAVFVHEGKQIVTASRDRSLKLVDASTGALIDILNRDSEPIQCLAKHPREDWVLFGSDVRPRLYKAVAKTDHSDPNADPNAIREFDNFEDGVTAVAFSPDGKWLACSGGPTGEVRVHDVSNARRKATLRGNNALIFGLSFSPDGKYLATAGYEGRVRIYDWAKEHLLDDFIPVPISPALSSTTQSGPDHASR